MSCNWPKVRLGDYCEKIGSGATPKGGKDTYLDSGPFRLIRSQNVHNNGFSKTGLAYIDEEQAKKLDGVSVLPGDVLLNITGDSVARVCQAPKGVVPARVNQHVAIIRPRKEEFDATYLRYFLLSPLQQDLMLGFASSGATRNALTKGMIESFIVPKPTLTEQKRISKALGVLDESIEVLQHQNTTLEAITQRLFRSWFVNFDPVHAKAVGQEPEAMSAELAALFPSEFENSALGLIPKGWAVTTFGDAFDIKGGATPSTADARYWEGGTHAWATPKDMSSLTSKVIYRTERKITAAGVAKISSKALPVDTVLLSSRAPVGYLAIAKAPISINQGFIAVPPTPGVSSSFVVELLAHKMPEIKANAGGTTFAEISKTQFRPIKWIRPCQKTLAAFGKVTDPLYAQIHANCRLVDALASLRDHILPRLISGKLSLADAEAALATVKPEVEQA